MVLEHHLLEAWGLTGVHNTFILTGDPNNCKSLWLLGLCNTVFLNLECLIVMLFWNI